MNKKRVDKLAIILAAACLLLAAGLVGLAFVFRGRQNRYEEVKKQLEKKEASKEPAGAEQGEASGEPADAEQGETLAQESPGSADSLSENDGAKTAHWDSLDGARPGYIVPPENLDMENLSKYFNAYDITEGDAVFQRINGKSYRENQDIGLQDLSYLLMLHYNYAGQIQVGEMIVNKAVAEDVRAIFQELFERQYPIQSMYLVDNYWQEGMDGTSADSASIDQNNTSAFNYRIATDSAELSNHAYGRAIDLNPLQNPYVLFDEAGYPYPAYADLNADYLNRARGHEIDHDDLAYEVFLKYGFTWGGDWVNPIDYQHFEKRP